MLQTASNVALLAPIPRVYLPEGQLLCQLQGKAAFGSRAWEVFRELDGLRHGLPIDVYIYASHADPPSDLEASWRAIYIGHVDSQGGAHPEGMKFRPRSTSKHPNDNQGWWAVFWELTDMHEIPKAKRIRIADFTGYGKRSSYKHAFIPEGPLLVEHP
jgi:hypothetical protein